MSTTPILYRRLLEGARGVCLERTRLPSDATSSWRAGARVVRIRFDFGVEGWFRAGPMKRLEREGTYEKLRRDPATILAETARHGPLALARVIGRACVVTRGAYYTHHPVLEDGTKVSIADRALRLLGALRGDQAPDLVCHIPDWLHLLASADPSVREDIPPDEAFLVPYTKRDRSLFPISSSPVDARLALWGALQCLLFDEGGLTVDASTRSALVALGRSVRQRDALMAPEALLRYETEDVVRFAHPMPELSDCPAWFASYIQMISRADPARDVGLDSDLPIFPYIGAP